MNNNLTISELPAYSNHMYAMYAAYNDLTIEEQLNQDKEVDSPNQTPVVRYQKFLSWIGQMKGLYMSCCKDSHITCMRVFNYMGFRQFLEEIVTINKR